MLQQLRSFSCARKLYSILQMFVCYQIITLQSIVQYFARVARMRAYYIYYTCISIRSPAGLPWLRSRMYVRTGHIWLVSQFPKSPFPISRPLLTIHCLFGLRPKRQWMEKIEIILTRLNFLTMLFVAFNIVK